MTINDPSIHPSAIDLIAAANAAAPIAVSDLVGLLPGDLPAAEKALLAQGAIALDKTSMRFRGTEPRASTVAEGALSVQVPTLISGRYAASATSAYFTFDPEGSIHGTARGPFGIHIGFRVTEIAIDTTAVVLSTDKGIGVRVVHANA
jgi:hypothetical protein